MQLLYIVFCLKVTTELDITKTSEIKILVFKSLNLYNPDFGLTVTAKNNVAFQSTSVYSYAIVCTWL